MAKKKTHIKLIILLLVLAAIIAGGVYLYSVVKTDIDGTDDDTVKYTLVIEDSDFAYEIAAKLMNAGIVKSETVWSWWMDKNYPDFTYYNGCLLYTSDAADE